MAQRQVDERPDHQRPPPTKASRRGRIRLRYHGDSPLISPLVKQGLVEAVAYPQSKVFEAAVQFARTEGVLPAPEPAHAVRAVVDEALRCKEQGFTTAARRIRDEIVGMPSPAEVAERLQTP